MFELVYWLDIFTKTTYLHTYISTQCCVTRIVFSPSSISIVYNFNHGWHFIRSRPEFESQLLLSFIVWSIPDHCGHITGHQSKYLYTKWLLCADGNKLVILCHIRGTSYFILNGKWGKGKKHTLQININYNMSYALSTKGRPGLHLPVVGYNVPKVEVSLKK